jgi:hypothetical protein
MARGPGGAPAYAAWLAHAGRLIASSQRLLIFPIANRLAMAVLLAPVVLADNRDAGFTTFARAAVQPDKTVIDLLGVAPLPASLVAAISLYLIGSVLVDAWLAGAFISSIRDGRLRWHDGWHGFANLVVVYAVAEAVEFGLGAYAGSHYGVLEVYLVLLLATAWPLLFADYAVILERRSAGSAFVRSFRLASRRWRETLTLLVTVIVVVEVLSGSLTQVLLDANAIFPPFFLAILLVDGLIRYCSDCAGIALLLEDAAPGNAVSRPGGADRAGD